ncbi:hypothetical protein L0665_04445 [Methanogenium marinum]|uniref:Uncharacterized protein n=1 Tax=Methanogenium marinum TaxID=348610 RepID=A0A9Q4KSN4_9EURY|nr:hypothetical protein [Methanogenium marinum]MDE4907859.1 hypothetical protein [Methanogenium marinum]
MEISVIMCVFLIKSKNKKNTADLRVYSLKKGLKEGGERVEKGWRKGGERVEKGWRKGGERVRKGWAGGGYAGRHYHCFRNSTG